MGDKIDIDPNDIFLSTHHMVSNAEHFSEEEYRAIEDRYKSMSHIQDPELSMAYFHRFLYEERFELLTCPKCHETCYFEWLALGYHKHSDCGHKWMETPWRTLWETIKRLFGPAKFDVKFLTFFSLVGLPLQLVIYLLSERSKNGGSSATESPAFEELLDLYDESQTNQDLDSCHITLKKLQASASSTKHWLHIACRTRGQFLEEIALPELFKRADTTRELQDLFFMVSDSSRHIREPILRKLETLAESYYDWKFIALYCPEEAQTVELLTTALRNCVELGEPDDTNLQSEFWDRITHYIMTYGRERIYVAGWFGVADNPDVRDINDFGFWYRMAAEAKEGSAPYAFAVAKMRELGTSDDWNSLRQSRPADNIFSTLAHDELRYANQKFPSQRQPDQLVDLGDDVALTLVKIPPGSFVMGGGDLSQSEQLPATRISFQRGFWLGKCPVTQAQYRAVTGMSPSANRGDNLPVESLSWEDAQAFLDALNRLGDTSGGEFRFPTEAEWEYACRAGSTGYYCFGNAVEELGEYAWFDEDAVNGSTHPVGRKMPNAWGLHDMHGNVREWCADEWHDNYSGAPRDGSAWQDGDGDRIVRGGHFSSTAASCRSATRDGREPNRRFDFVGLRVARTAKD